MGNSPQLRKIIDMVRSGKIKQMPIDRRPLSEINQAVHDLEKVKSPAGLCFNLVRMTKRGSVNNETI